jgi:predicted phosphodiesterase
MANAAGLHFSMDRTPTATDRGAESVLPSRMRLAIIADVHGNLLALEAVLADLRPSAPDLVVNLGDLVSGPFQPEAAAAAQMALACPTLRGNHDRWVVRDKPAGRTDALARGLLSAASLAWLADLPPTLRLADGAIFACHGSPAGGDEEYLLEDLAGERPVLASPGAIAPRLAGIGDASIVLCGHTHLPRIVTIGGVLVVNPGSVGWAAYRDDRPAPHAVEVGSPHARYAILTRTPSGWLPELRAVPYDWGEAACQAERHGRPDIAHAVRTGRVPPTAG